MDHIVFFCEAIDGGDNNNNNSIFIFNKMHKGEVNDHI